MNKGNCKNKIRSAYELVKLANKKFFWGDWKISSLMLGERGNVLFYYLFSCDFVSIYLSCVMEIIIGYIFRQQWGQVTSNWSKTLKGRILKSLPFIWYVTWHWIRKSHCCGHEGHLRLHFQSGCGQMTFSWSKTGPVKYWSNYLSFVILFAKEWKKVIVVVIEVIWGHICCHGENKWPPIGLKHWKVKYRSHYLSF